MSKLPVEMKEAENQETMIFRGISGVPERI